MLFVIAEDGMVAVLENEIAAERRYEAIDVENGVFSFYAEDGSWLKPRFVRPNKRRLFGFVVENGEYKLELASGEDPVMDTFEVAIAEVRGMEPNRYFSSLSEIGFHVKKRQNACEEDQFKNNKLPE